jgi:damage-control phosphatase, subfamily III
MWEASTPFDTAIGPLGGKSDLRILALRTCKADCIAGLPKGKDEELRAAQGKDPSVRAWAWNGEWAVCQFNDGKL